MNTVSRLSTGIPDLDQLLGGGLLPGTLTVVLGATGIGKTQLGLQFARNGLDSEGQSGVIFDMATRGDSQSHHQYAQRMFGWSLTGGDLADRDTSHHAFDHVWDPRQARRDYLHAFRRSGRRVTIRDMEFDDWKEWKQEFANKLQGTIAFFYGNFIHGVRRCVIDGVEPTEQASDSFQLHTFDYIYHQILHKEDTWVARDLLRVKFRGLQPLVDQHRYDHSQIACLLLYTTHEVMLDDLLTRPIESGDELANANTVILMGKVRDGAAMHRALHVAKHRGSACSDRIAEFEITDQGLRLKS